MGASNRRQEGLDAWQGQGLDEVLRPVQPLGPVQAGQLAHNQLCSSLSVPHISAGLLLAETVWWHDDFAAKLLGQAAVEDPSACQSGARQPVCSFPVCH